jgi:probable F420-dependent oxidoreductase
MTGGIDLRFGALLSVIDANIGDASRAIEDQGWDFLTTGEHVSFNIPIANSFVSLAAAAAATSRIELMSSVTLLPLYPAALAAKLGAALDNVSGGRFVLGVGVGGENPREFEACGVPVGERGPRTDEGLEIIRRLWTSERVTYAGQYAQLVDVSVRPAPVRKPNPPIWIAGRREVAMRRAARFGDGWMPYMYSASMLADSLDAIAGQRADLAPIEGGAYLWSCVHEDPAVAFDYAMTTLAKTYRQDFAARADSYFVIGDPDHCVERVLEYVRAGARRIIFAHACPAHYVGAQLELLANRIIPAVRAELAASLSTTTGGRHQ